MRSYPLLGSLIRMSVFAAAAALAISVSYAKGPPREQAQLLDHAELLCDNCLFGASDYFFCFATGDNKILIGYQRMPVLNWDDKSKNYLAKAHPRWTTWKPTGEMLPISFDDKHIWVDRPDGEVKTGGGPLRFFMHENKQVKLIRGSRDIFLNNDRCREAGRAAAR